MTNEITQRDYQQTMTSGMIDVTSTADAIVDIWPYVEILAKQNPALTYIWKNQLIEKVYRSGDKNFDHIILPTDDPNNFIVLIIKRNTKSIPGHHLLDLNKEYEVTG